MHDSDLIIRLYETVLQRERQKFHLKQWEIQKAIVNMVKIYAPEPSLRASTDVMYVDYNEPASRCAYLHKYASFHTALVTKMLERAIEENPEVFSSLNNSGNIELCSLGGGPGSDVIGVLAAFSNFIPGFRISVNVLDCMKKWEETFDAVVQEIRDGEYGSLSDSVLSQNYDWKTYIETDLYKINDKARRAVVSANLITMVKFVSAAACEELQCMIKNIFSLVKPGALILYIDNAHRRFYGVLREEAKLNKFQNVAGPLEHEHFIDTTFRKEKFGIPACFETTVSVYLWKKPSHTILEPLTISNFLQQPSIKLIKSKAKFKKSASDSYSSKAKTQPKSSANNILEDQKSITHIPTNRDEWPTLREISNFTNKQSSLTKQASKLERPISKGLNLYWPVNHLSDNEYSSNNSETRCFPELKCFQSKLIKSTEKKSYHDQYSNYLSVQALVIAKTGAKYCLRFVIRELFSLIFNNTNILLAEAFEENNNFEIINTDGFMNHLYISL